MIGIDLVERGLGKRGGDGEQGRERGDAKDDGDSLHD